jgi:hypothetical protein
VIITRTSEHKKEYMRGYYLKNRERLLARQKEYNKQRKKEYYLANRIKLLAYQKLYQETHPDVYQKGYNKAYNKVRTNVLTHYGNGKCACVKCGFNDMRALSIDHINGRGNQHRKDTKMTSSYSFYLWLRRQGYPDGYQTLCMNCQVIKRKVNHEAGKMSL